MATNTTNYSLTKPAYTDTADIADINGNMDTVDSALTKLCNDLAIVEFGNNSTHSISNGSFVVWKGDLYIANQNISNGAALSGKLTAVANGGLNNLNNLYDMLNSNKANKSTKINSSTNITSSATLSYTGVSFSIPEGKEFGAFVRASYTNNEPLEIAISTSNTNMYGYNTYARSTNCNTVSVSGNTDSNTIGAITFYVWAKYSGAGTNKIIVSGYYRDI